MMINIRTNTYENTDHNDGSTTTSISKNTDHHDEAHEKAGLFKSPRHREERGAHHCVPDSKAENGD